MYCHPSAAYTIPAATYRRPCANYNECSIHRWTVPPCTDFRLQRLHEWLACCYVHYYSSGPRDGGGVVVRRSGNKKASRLFTGGRNTRHQPWSTWCRVFLPRPSLSLSTEYCLLFPAECRRETLTYRRCHGGDMPKGGGYRTPHCSAVCMHIGYTYLECWAK